jgi:hypothetical protein
LRKEELINDLSDALAFAEKTRSLLWVAGSLMALLITSPQSDGKSSQEISKNAKETANALYDHWGTERIFWSKLEIPFNVFIQTLPNDSSAMDRWKATLQQTARDSLAGAERLTGESTTALKAAVKARDILAYGLKKLFSEIQTQKEVEA